MSEPTPPKIDELLKIAKELGLALIPMKRGTKMPAWEWRRVIEGRPFTEDELRDGWRWPEYNPAIVCGASDLVAVDADNEAACRWVLNNWPKTDMRTITGGSGCHAHFFYRRPEGGMGNRVDILGSKARWAHEARELGIEVRARTTANQGAAEFEAEVARAEEARAEAMRRVKMGPIIDIRGDGGYVLGLGALHPSGRPYRMWRFWTPKMKASIPVFDPAWLDGLKWSPPEKVTDLKVWLGERAQEAELRAVGDDERVKRASAYLATIDEAIEGQGGDRQTFYAACRMVQGFDLDVDTAFRLLVDEYNPRCRPPWTEEALAHKVMCADNIQGPKRGWLLAERRRAGGIRTIPEAVLDESDFEGSTATVATEVDDEADAGMQALFDRLGIDYRRQIKGRGVKWSLRMVNDRPTLPPDINNLAMALEHSRYLAAWRPRHNNLKMTYVKADGARLDDPGLNSIYSDLQHLWNGRTVSRNLSDNAVMLVAHRNNFDPPREWLESLGPWDGVPRLETLPRRILGADDAPVIGVMFRHFMTGMVARMMEPGSKVDTILFLVSEGQGAFKSQFFRQLIDGPKSEGRNWFTDARIKLDDRDSQMVAGVNVLVEWGEGEHAKSAQKIDAVKTFLARETEEFRMPYGRLSIERPRRCVFCGTSNDLELLHDPSGDRRFYIIRTCEQIDVRAMLEEREQLFAEALDLWRRHKAAEWDSDEWNATRWWFTGKEDLERRRAVAAFRARGVWHDDIVQWVAERGAEPFLISDVFDEVIQDRRSKRLETEIKMTLASIGCVQSGRKRHDGRLGRWWHAKTDNLP